MQKAPLAIDFSRLPGDDHGQAELIGPVDDFLVFHRAKRIDDGCNAVLSGQLDDIRERHEGIRCHNTSLGPVAAFRVTDGIFCRIDAASLARADAVNLIGFADDNGVGPGE